MSNFEGVRALIIEDDSTSVYVLQSLLDSHGVVCEVMVESHWIAEELERINVPNVVFLDLEMPGTNGYEVLEILRNDPRFDQTPIIAYTTHISHMNEARTAGFDGFLGKPLDSKAFANQLANILNGVAVWDAR